MTSATERFATWWHSTGLSSGNGYVPLPTEHPGLSEQEGLQEALDAEFERLHPRGRAGQWIRKLGIRIFEVGGAVRDPLLGKRPKDVDYMAMASPERIKRAVEEAGGRAEDLTVRDRLVGVRAHHKDLPKEGVEIAPPRIENSTGAGRHDFEIVPHPGVMGGTGAGGQPLGQGSIMYDDALRRDFTVNTLLRDVDGNVIDPTGMGLSDLTNRQLRTTHPDSFRDDPLRILRGARFVSQHGLSIEPDTLKQMNEHADAVTGLTQKGVSGTVREEMDKLLMGEYPGEGLRVLRDSGALAHLFPELAPSIGFDQESRYHTMTVDEHTFRVVEEVARQGGSLEARLAALFHDSGKPGAAWRGKDGRLHYYGNPDGGLYYHGSARRKSEFTDRPGGTYLTTHPTEAEGYGEHSQPVEFTPKNPLRIDSTSELRQYGIEPQVGYLDDAGKRKLRELGYDSLILSFPEDIRDPSDPYPPRENVVVLDPSIIRPGTGRLDHAEVGEGIATTALRRMNYPREVINDVATLVREHMLSDSKSPKGSRARRLRARMTDKQLADLFVHRRADMRGKGEDDDGTPGTQPDVDTQKWMTGGCGVLAKEIMDRTGWPLVAEYSDEERADPHHAEFPSPDHVGNRHPNGMMVDARGMVPMPDDAEPISADHLERLFDADHLPSPEYDEYKDVEQVADAVLDSVPKAVDTSGIDRLEQLVAENAGAPRSLADLKISGADLLERGWKPGPGMGAFLRRVFGEVLGSPDLNTRDWLLAQAEKRRRKYDDAG